MTNEREKIYRVNALACNNKPLEYKNACLETGFQTGILVFQP
ncbi:hypothetical protein [Neisseria wadsworthii]|uniref:Uncharacterized protein n=1 Tax=Neisseria wadsworthii 9715 TaxID=1030841 RepID=G4CP40_9NEIS|nr:hypothetical protein [Neisseria wadsworthii]EGZ48554.1 hypothetical protein HMPREF9370_0849 [Neisseria wadsworthii 9715]